MHGNTGHMLQSQLVSLSSLDWLTDSQQAGWMKVVAETVMGSLGKWYSKEQLCGANGAGFLITENEPLSEFPRRRHSFNVYTNIAHKYKCHIFVTHNPLNNTMTTLKPCHRLAWQSSKKFSRGMTFPSCYQRLKNSVFCKKIVSLWHVSRFSATRSPLRVPTPN